MATSNASRPWYEPSPAIIQEQAIDRLVENKPMLAMPATKDENKAYINQSYIDVGVFLGLAALVYAVFAWRSSSEGS